MATEQAGDSELSVTLSPSLHEWLEERAMALGIEREALLVQLLGTYRTAADLDDDGLVELFETTDFDETIEKAIEARLESDRMSLDGVEEHIGEIDGRIDDLEAKLTNNVEDIRNRVLQLRDALEERAPADHDHPEIGELSERINSLSTDIENVERELGAFSGEIDAVDERLEGIDTKLDRLARAVVTLKRREEDADTATEQLDHIRRSANRSGKTKAACGGCGGTIQIDLLTEPACPHCDLPLCGLEQSESLLRWFKPPTLTVEESDVTDRTDQKNHNRQPLNEGPDE